jgi:ectoine hydroxylase-related dioxygenase (phytanoyl-CoA dioxygenase family)
LQDNTTLDVFDDQGEHKLLALDAGDILLFRSDLVHAGSAYTEDNLRLHAYLDSPFVKRITNRTWYKKSLQN